jgi:MarR family transcriptional regulator, transcriptional regulator for hemolysin
MTRDREFSFGYQTNLIARLFARALDKRLDGGSLGPMPVFVALQGDAALPQKELARLAAVEQPTMANTLMRMERDGLIRRDPDPKDGRSVLIRLTREGRQRAAVSIAAAREVDALGMSALSETEQTAFLAMLARIGARLTEDVQG